jgi:hypothetical protein
LTTEFARRYLPRPERRVNGGDLGMGKKKKDKKKDKKKKK